MQFQIKLVQRHFVSDRLQSRSTEKPNNSMAIYSRPSANAALDSHKVTTMKTLRHDQLKSLVEKLFAKHGCGSHEAERIAHYLVEANLAGHDSHGVIRAPFYVLMTRHGSLSPIAAKRLVSKHVDGRAGILHVPTSNVYPASRAGFERRQNRGKLAPRSCSACGTHTISLWLLQPLESFRELGR